MYSRQDILLRWTQVWLSLWGRLLLCVLLGCGGLCDLALAADGAPVKIRLFGTMEFRGPLKSLPAWLGVLQRNEGHSIFIPGSKLNASTTWEDFKSKTETLSPLEQLKAVNLFWNKWPYREDRDVYGKADYWAIPEQFRKNSGDCEDYSIAKYFTLRALGVDIDTMRIVVL
ncbi:MAG: transglutaminase-like cysteine peptidase, partial [Bilophila sp.]